TAIDLAVVSLNVRVSASARLIPRPLATESDIETESVTNRAWDAVRDGVSDNDIVSVTDRVMAIAERIAESLKDTVYVIERVAEDTRDRVSLNKTVSVTDLEWAAVRDGESLNERVSVTDLLAVAVDRATESLNAKESVAVTFLPIDRATESLNDTVSEAVLATIAMDRAGTSL